MQIVLLTMSLIISILYIRKIWRVKPIVLFIGALFFLEMIWQFVSIVWLDNGAYISEQIRYSYFTGASFRYTILILPFAILYPWFLNRDIKRNQTMTIRFKINQGSILGRGNSLVIMALIIIYLVIDVICSGNIPLFSGINMGTYYLKYSKFPLCSFLQDYILPFISLLLGASAGRCKRDKIRTKKYFGVFALVVLLQILLNCKFYGLYDYILQFILAYAVASGFGEHETKKKIPIRYIVFGIIFLGSILFICITKYSNSVINPVQYLLDRVFSLQSHTFWGVDMLIQKKQLSADYAGFWHEVVQGVISDVSRLNPNYGIARVMYMVTVDTYAGDMLKSGYLFSGSYITVLISYLGYVPVFFVSIILAWVTSKFSFLMYKCIKHRNGIVLFFSFFVFKRFYEYFRVGNLAMIINWKFIIIYIVFACMWIGQKSVYKNN